MTDSSTQQLFADMQALEDELEGMSNEWSDAEDALIRATATVERYAAPRRLVLKRQPPPGIAKPTKEDLDAMVLEWLWSEHEPTMVEQLNSEALCAAFKTKYKCAERALSSKQSRLGADVKIHGATASHR